MEDSAAKKLSDVEDENFDEEEEFLTRDDRAKPQEAHVHFKDQLVDLEVPPQPVSSSSSSDEEKIGAYEVTTGINDLNLSSFKPNEDTVEISGQFLRKDEKILVEIGGKFHVVEAAELEKNLATSQVGESNHKKVLPFMKPHPRSAPPGPSNRLAPLRSASATPDYYKMKSTPTFSYPEETKKLIRKQATLKAKRIAEEESRRKEEERMAREEAEEAWKSWAEKKRREIKARKKREEEEKKIREREKWKDPVEINEAYSSWMKQKMTQIKKERIVTQQQLIEHDEGWYLRERRDCNRAFRVWLRNKNEMARKAKENEMKVRRKSIREMRRARKAQKLLEKIRESQQMKYVDYYGYRI